MTIKYNDTKTVETSERCECSPRCEDHPIFCGQLCDSCHPVSTGDDDLADYRSTARLDRNVIAHALSVRLGIPESDCRDIVGRIGQQSPPKESDDAIQHIAGVLLATGPSTGAHAWGIASNQISEYWRTYHKAGNFQTMGDRSELSRQYVQAVDRHTEAVQLVTHDDTDVESIDWLRKAEKTLKRAEARIDTALETMRRDALMGEAEFTLAADADATIAEDLLPHKGRCARTRCVDTCLRIIVSLKLAGQALTASQRRSLSEYANSDAGEQLHLVLTAA